MSNKIPSTDKANSFNLKGGVLIIGSLLWQDYLEKEGDDIRKTWRAEHLIIDHKIMVSAPIRYGRFSQKNKIFTMVFSNTVGKNKFGTGYFVPLRNPNITTTEELFNEAVALSIAEGMKGEFHTNWSVLGLLINDKMDDKQLKIKLTASWQEKITAKNQFNHQSYKLQKNEKPCIKSNGLLNFKWPFSVDDRKEELLNLYDFIIATATIPTEYPTIGTLSNNVSNDKTRYYFIENYKSGITTFQDIPVINSLKNAAKE